MKKLAFVIANTGLGDSIAISGLVRYLATKYEKVFTTCIIEFYEQIKLFYTEKNIIIYPLNTGTYNTEPYEFTKYMLSFRNIYDLYPVGNYNSVMVDNDKYIKKTFSGEIKKIIQNYPVSYYEDANIPPDYMTKYFKVTYPKEILNLYEELLTKYQKYRVVHVNGSNANVNPVGDWQHYDPNNMLTINVNENIYPVGHEYYDICNKFIKFPSIIYYAKLLENATELFLIDSCIHALALLVDISKANKKYCYKRESRFDYGVPNKFQYFNLIFKVPEEKLEEYRKNGMYKVIEHNDMLEVIKHNELAQA